MFTYTVGGKHKEIVFLETESAKERKKKFYELIKTKIVAGYLGKTGNIRVRIPHLKLHQVILDGFSLLLLPYPHSKNCVFFVNQPMGCEIK